MTVLTRAVAVTWLAVGVAPVHVTRQGQGFYQADLMVHSFQVVHVADGLEARAVVGVDGDGDVRGASVQFLLPVAVGVVRVSRGCTAGPTPPGIRDLHGRVVCQLGNLRGHERREFSVVTTVAPAGIRTTFGVVALSDTPDPRPQNNFVQKVIP